MITESQFLALAAQGYNRIPLVLESFADLDTPLSLYLKLANRSNTYLLESVVGGERFGRYSFIGLAAPVRLRAVGRLVTVAHGDAVTERSQAADPLEFVRQFQSLENGRGVPVVMITTEAGQGRVGEAFTCGARGYIRKPFTPEQIREQVASLLG